jgi:hypothetical protein
LVMIVTAILGLLPISIHPSFDSFMHLTHQLINFILTSTGLRNPFLSFFHFALNRVFKFVKKAFRSLDQFVVFWDVSNLMKSWLIISKSLSQFQMLFCAFMIAISSIFLVNPSSDSLPHISFN